MIVKVFEVSNNVGLDAKVFNTGVERRIDNLVCRYRSSLPHGWRCCIELQHRSDEEQEPYYVLDLQSNHGGGEFAPIKMQTLKHFPKICATGNIALPGIIEVLNDAKDVVPATFFERVSGMSDVNDLTEGDWIELKKYGLTHWYGGIRVPYDMLETDVQKDIYGQISPELTTHQKFGEIRITFSGAKEWQDTFFCFSILEQIQSLMISTWRNAQLWYNLRGFENDTKLQFWVDHLRIPEAPEK